MRCKNGIRDLFARAVTVERSASGETHLGYRALVCGASKGIGRAIAVELARQGFQILAVARDAQSLQSLISELGGQGHEAWVMDLTDHGNLMAQLKVRDLSGVAVLINNISGPKGGPLATALPSELSDGFHAHLVTAQILMQSVLPAMKSQKFGRIVNVISTSVKAPIPNLGVSNTVRGAMANWAKTLASELGPEGITVNNVLPGFTKTDRFESLKKATAEREKKSLSEIENQWLATIPARRFAEPSEIAKAVAFLTSQDASYINGINLPVDGGRTPSL